MSDTFTPLMKQYHAIKAQYPDAILLFRVGDFYEMFGDDAITGAKLLKLTLTKKHVGKDQTVPLAGVPYHAVQSYLARLIRQGCKVAICEQMEDPKSAKGIVKRDVIRVITPGTVLESSLLDEKVNNFLVAINLKQETQNSKLETIAVGFAVMDLSTGEFQVTEFNDSKSLSKLQTELQRLQPRECLIPNDVGLNESSLQSTISNLKSDITIYPYNGYYFDTDTAYRELTRQFGTTSLKGFGCEDLKLAIGSAGAIVTYLKETQKANLEHIRALQTYSIEEFLTLDASTLQNLEIFKTSREGNKEGSLLGVIDQTMTAMGGRKLRSWLSQPLLNIEKLKLRQDAVQSFVENHSLRNSLREHLDNIYDLERLLGRIGCGLGNARDLLALAKSLDLIPQVKQLISDTTPFNSPSLVKEGEKEGAQGSLIQELLGRLNDIPELRDLICRAITDDPPLSIKEGGLIKDGYNAELDELRQITRGGKQWIVELEAKEKDRTTIKSLKVRYNNVFGYYIEVTKPNLHLVPADYQRKQTISNSERFITPELKEWESKILGAEERMMELEYALFCELRDKVAEFTQPIQETADAIAQLDTLSALAVIAVNQDYCRPTLSDDTILDIRDGRHPVIEQVLTVGQFVPNDALLNTTDNKLLLITGPNMAGKSTYIRQVALIALLAQIGSYVPAKSAKIGLVDRIFTRVGAADNLLRGESTFMVEMNETANILHNATNRSLLVLDEIGRGTSTFDGLSIAWAVAEYIHDKIGARTLFATHYHELTQLANMLSGIKNYNVAVREWQDQVIFLHKIIEGACDRSYGIAVGRLAGLPDDVITRAKEVLVDLEKYSESAQSELARTHANVGNIRPAVSTVQLTFFESASNPLLEELKKLDLTNLTPLQALTKLQEIQEKLKKS